MHVFSRVFETIEKFAGRCYRRFLKLFLKLLGNMLRRNEAWACCSVDCLFLQKVLLPEHLNLVITTCCMKFSWFEFVSHEMKRNDLNFQCHVCIALTKQSIFNIEMNQYLLHVHQLAYSPSNTLPIRTHEGACPRDMSTSVCTNIYLFTTKFHQTYFCFVFLLADWLSLFFWHTWRW